MFFAIAVAFAKTTGQYVVHRTPLLYGPLV